MRNLARRVAALERASPPAEASCRSRRAIPGGVRLMIMGNVYHGQLPSVHQRQYCQ